jgi:Leucine-rich repeat (LRR) protein
LSLVLDVKEAPLHLDTLDLSFNRISAVSDLSRHKTLRVLRLKGNKIAAISGVQKNKALRILDLSENQIE